MSCLHYQSSDPSREKIYFNGHYSSQYRYSSPFSSTSTRSPETYSADCYSGSRPSEIPGNFVETANNAARGDPPFPEARTQAGRIIHAYKQDAPRSGETISIEKIQGRLKFLEESNSLMQKRNQNLVKENKGLTSQLEEERNETKKRENIILSMDTELNCQRVKLEEVEKEIERSNESKPKVKETTTSTNIVSTTDRGVQIWAVCKSCRKKLESCEKEPPTVTISKSELEVLEKDMQTLRDTIIAREDAWDKAMEREQNYRQQLTRLTAETITARHLSETRYEELEALNNVLSEKDTELKSMQKENQYLNKLIVKLRNHQRDICNENSKVPDDSQGLNSGIEISEKDRKIIDEMIRRGPSAKSRQKSKPKFTYPERVAAYSNVCQSSPRDSKISRAVKDQPCSLREPKR